MNNPQQMEQYTTPVKFNIQINPLTWALIPEWSSFKSLDIYMLNIAFLCFILKIQKRRDVVIIEREEEISGDASPESKQTTKT
jgi:hypothetical protein